jgi:hypothetical protein
VATVEPLVDFTRLEYVRLLEYARVLPPERLEELQQEIYGPPLPPGFVAPTVPAEPLAGLAPRDVAAGPAAPEAAP